MMNTTTMMSITANFKQQSYIIILVNNLCNEFAHYTVKMKFVTLAPILHVELIEWRPFHLCINQSELSSPSL